MRDTKNLSALIMCNQMEISTHRKNEQRPTVSIVMPCFNPKRDDLCDALESCIAQTVAPLEVLVLDDGSNLTNAFEAIENYNGSLISYHRFSHRGPGLIRNEGNKLAKGNYVVYLDCDDILSPCFVEFVQALALKEPDLIAFGSGESVSRAFSSIQAREYEGKKSLHFLNRIVSGIERPEIRSIWAKAFRLDFLRANNLWFEELPQGEDQLFMYRLYACKPRIVTAPSFVGYRYITTESSTSVVFEESKVSVFLDLSNRLWEVLNRYMPADIEKRREYFYMVACEYIPRLFKIVYCNKANPKPRRIRRREAILLCRHSTFRRAIAHARYADCLSKGKKWTLFLLKMRLVGVLFWHYEL